MSSNPIYKEQFETEVLDSTGYALIVWIDEVNIFVRNRRDSFSLVQFFFEMHTHGWI
jgi:hypothetical protein